MHAHRPARYAALIHRELASRLRLDSRDARLAELSITHVEVSRDLRRAVIHWLPLGGGEVGPGLSEALDEAARRLRGPIGRALRARHAPELIFTLDTHTEKAVQLTELLSQLGREEHKEDNDS